MDGVLDLSTPNTSQTFPLIFVQAPQLTNRTYVPYNSFIATECTRSYRS